MTATMEVDKDTLERATQALDEAKKTIDGGFQKMEQSNKRVDELLQKQEAIEQGAAEDRGSLKKIQDELAGQATRMETIAQEHTATIELVRKQMKIIGQSADDASDRGAFMFRHPNAKGAIFESRQQALELGMYFLATMRKDGETKARARRWLSDHKQDLRYLPQIPKSFVETLGQEWLENTRKLESGDVHIQDLRETTTPGSIFVRPQFANTLIRNVEEQGVFRQEALVWPMASDLVKIPKRVAGVAVYWEGEGDTGVKTDPEFTLLSMTAKKMMAMHQFSSEVNEDAAIALADIMMFEFAHAIATEEDRIGFNGDGSGGSKPGCAGFFGVLGMDAHADPETAKANNVPILVTGAAGADLTTEISLRKLREMTGKQPMMYESGSKWFMSKSIQADIEGIETTGGGPVVSFKEGAQPSMLGYLIRRVDQMPKSYDVGASTKCLAYGNLRKALILGDRRTPTVETSEHFAFDTDQITTRVTARISFLRAQADALVVYKTGTT